MYADKSKDNLSALVHLIFVLESVISVTNRCKRNDQHLLNADHYKMYAVNLHVSPILPSHFIQSVGDLTETTETNSFHQFFE